MKKKLLAAIIGGTLLIGGTLGLSGCGNYDMFDVTYSFDYAIIQLPNGEIKEGKVAEWTDYNGEQLQITFEDGSTHLTNSFRCELIKNK